MLDSLDEKFPHPGMLKAVFALAAIFVVALLGFRLAGLVRLLSEVLSGSQLLVVEPAIPGDFWLAVGVGLALLACLLPATLRKPAWAVLCAGILLMVALGGNQAAPGGAGLSASPVGHWLGAEGYARCPAHDQVRHGLHSTTVAEGWAKPGACPVLPAGSALSRG